MKVLQVLPELNSGGVERATLAMADFLVEQGHESLVLSNGGSLSRDLTAQGSTHHSLPVHRKSLLSLRLVPQIKNLLHQHRPDILHLRSRAPAWLCYLAWKQLPSSQRPRLITTFHGFYSINSYSAIMTRGQKVICVSDSVKAHILKNYPNTPKEKLTVIHEGIDPNLFSPTTRPSTSWLDGFYTSFPETKGKTLLTLPGRVTRLKGHATFLNLFTKLAAEDPLLHALIVGGASPRKQAYLEELRQLTSSLGLTDKVTFTGQRNDLSEILSLSQLTYSLSEQPETFGLTALESLSLGTPVVGYNDGGVSETLSKLFPQGLIERDDPETLLKVSQSILASSPKVSENTQFLLTETHRKTLDLYQDLLEQSS